MQLIKDKWTQNDAAQLNVYLESFKNEDRIDWARRIINTSRPILAISSKKLGEITKEISKGNFISLLELSPRGYYETVIIKGGLIGKIKDLKTKLFYLDLYAEEAENWAECDMLKLQITKKDFDIWFDKALSYAKNEKTFVRRTAYIICFSFLDDKDYCKRTLELLNQSGCEKEYYVNMAMAWLLAECFIKQRELALEFFKNNNLNAAATNFAVSKCRQSYRVTQEDKDMLLSYKRQK